MRDNAIPFSKGQTAYQGRTIDSANLLFAELLGMVKVFEDRHFETAGAQGVYSGHRVKAMVVRNKAGVAVTPGQAVELDTVNPYEIKQTAQTVNGPYAIVDYYLPSAGCPANDCCWVTIAGPTVAAVIPGSGADVAAGAYLGADSTSKGVLIPHTLGATSGTNAFDCALNSSFLLEAVTKTASTVYKRVYVRSKFQAAP